MHLPATALSAALLTGAVLLTGCTGGAVDDDPQAGSNRPTADAPADPAAGEAEVAPEPEPEPVDEGPAVLSFGQTFTYENGVSLTVGAPGPYTPSEYAMDVAAPHVVVFPITIVNGSSAPIDPAMWYATVQSQNVEAEKVYDSEALGDEPSTSLLPGREAAFKVGYGVGDPADLVMEVTPGMMEYQDVLYTNAQ